MENTEKLAFNAARLRGITTAAQKFIGTHGPAVKQLGHNLFSSKPWIERSLSNPTGNMKNNVIDMVRHRYLGSPIDLYNNIKNNGIGSVVKNHFFPKFTPGPTNLHTIFNRGSQALAFGVPALQLGISTLTPPEQRGSAIGGTLANIATSPVTSMLGAPGNWLSNKATMIGSRIGARFNKKDEFDYPG